MKKSKKITTIEGLARMIQGEFVVLRTEMKGGFLKIEDDIRNLHQRIDLVERRIDELKKELKEEIAELRRKLNNVVRHRELETLEARVVVLERRVGIKSNTE